MERAEIRVLKQTDEMRFTSFLQREDRKTLKSDVVPHVLSYFLHQPTKGSLPHQKIRRSLVTTNFPQRYSAWPKTSSRSLRNPSALPAIACCPGSVGLVAPSRYGRITLLDSNHDDQWTCNWTICINERMGLFLHCGNSSMLTAHKRQPHIVTTSGSSMLQPQAAAAASNDDETKWSLIYKFLAP